jgi:DNA-binding MarR family transcriptional regulator
VSSKKVEQVADLQHSAAIRLLRYVRRDDTASGITGAQLSVLSVLFYGGPQTPSALAATEQVRPPSMTQLLSALERLGLIKRTPLNGRSTAVTITDRGRDLFEAGRRRRLARLAGALSKLSTRELDALGESARLILSVTAPAKSDHAAAARAAT